ncbi:hypothetical protein [Cellulomonas triticagri]|uniref:Uncharacterized protein n=1 Tax=Cellulomonas triticagri TaxID=2483352 RepID=A0A3M2J5C8_9CELL|nr:hypothetical protein [Cellulomonas triticagri]RMI06733.1 hypothetical protein EBM89_15340 [Cellulomonas triticagri]
MSEPPKGTRVFFFVVIPLAFLACLWLLLTTDDPSPRLVIGTVAGGVAVIGTLVVLMRRKE